MKAKASKNMLATNQSTTNSEPLGATSTSMYCNIKSTLLSSLTQHHHHYNMSINSCCGTFVDLVLLNTFQNRKVSSPAPVTIDSPSGDMALKN